MALDLLVRCVVPLGRIVSVALLVAGCAPKRVIRSEGSAPRRPPATTKPGGESGKDGKRSLIMQPDLSSVGPIYFAFESAILSHEARTTLTALGQRMWKEASLVVTIAGHADERGTPEYNVALGDERARAVRDYLVGLGIAPSRLRTVSFGEERPAFAGSHEEAWSKNRRAEFVLNHGQTSAR